MDLRVNQSGCAYIHTVQSGIHENTWQVVLGNPSPAPIWSRRAGVQVSGMELVYVSRLALQCIRAQSSPTSQKNVCTEMRSQPEEPRFVSKSIQPRAKSKTPLCKHFTSDGFVPNTIWFPFHVATNSVLATSLSSCLLSCEDEDAAIWVLSNIFQIKTGLFIS